MQIKLLLVTFYSNGRLHAFLSENRLNICQIFECFHFLKTESEPNFGFQHIPRWQGLIVSAIRAAVTCWMLADLDVVVVCCCSLHDRKLFLLGICTLLSLSDVRQQLFLNDTQHVLSAVVTVFTGLQHAYESETVCWFCYVITSAYDTYLSTVDLRCKAGRWDFLGCASPETGCRRDHGCSSHSAS